MTAAHRAAGQVLLSSEHAAPRQEHLLHSVAEAAFLEILAVLYRLYCIKD